MSAAFDAAWLRAMADDANLTEAQSRDLVNIADHLRDLSEQVSQLEPEAERLRERVKELETPQWYLRAGDEQGSGDLDDLFDDCEIGEVHQVDCGTFLADRWVAVLPDPDYPDEGDTTIVRDFATEAEARAAVTEAKAGEST